MTSKRKDQQINSVLCKEKGRVTLAKNEKLSDTCPIKKRVTAKGRLKVT